MQPKWMSVRQVAEHFNCSMDVIYTDLKTGRIQGEKLVKNGRAWNWIIDRAKLPVSREWVCANCDQYIGEGDSPQLTPIHITPEGKHIVDGPTTRYCSEDCLYKRCARKQPLYKRWGVLINA